MSCEAKASPATPLVAILGPTASGKSALAVSLAQRFGGEVIACDSAQVYRGFDIGTGKPGDEERGGIPHHLMDVVEPSQLFTAGEYRRLAIELLADLRQRGRLPIFTVGTGLYLRALIEGLADAPTRSEALRARLAASATRRGSTHLHRILGRFDAAAAARISPNDRQKLIRALEVCLLTGRPLTTVLETGRQGLKHYAPVKIGLQPSRAALYARIDRRVQAMLNRGWRAEVAGLLDMGVPPSAKPFEFIGYRELCAHLILSSQLSAAAGGGDSMATVGEAIAQATRRYAKRQLTWFRKERDVHWMPGFGDDAEVIAAVLRLLERSLPGRPRAAQSQAENIEGNGDT